MWMEIMIRWKFEKFCELRDRGIHYISPDEKMPMYHLVRNAETFPDVFSLKLDLERYKTFDASKYSAIHLEVYENGKIK